MPGWFAHERGRRPWAGVLIVSGVAALLARVGDLGPTGALDQRGVPGHLRNSQRDRGERRAVFAVAMPTRQAEARRRRTRLGAAVMDGIDALHRLRDINGTHSKRFQARLCSAPFVRPACALQQAVYSLTPRHERTCAKGKAVTTRTRDRIDPTKAQA